MKIRKELWFGFVLMALIVTAIWLKEDRGVNPAA